ncbi:hypothetical protein AB0L34_32485, partial [Micromonospora sp. NPDC052213]|uniref:hypothetical protein n=1 Tax=Micromonospora sp. NPDC052213 TaxID=3155812 RepID=UPI003420D953
MADLPRLAYAPGEVEQPPHPAQGAPVDEHAEDEGLDPAAADAVLASALAATPAGHSVLLISHR